MKKGSNKYFIITIMIFMMVFSVYVVSAQPGGGPPPPPPPPTAVPFGGLELLLAAGAALGIKKFVDSRKKD
ncbi:hypothetical protein OO013_15165 [Mangrovivirga sp. M17]|uniref:Uncharacterized protein n=1 Tax=Mangrovivirga halotolerans TaxID=2993936 RepID=A0ABT3RTV6_9BACT|nr:hypothetical protein [Mangrovivirga halotolerans]MCX2745219.1 hypothetical protein [Mangrovivirga halotolerans]